MTGTLIDAQRAALSALLVRDPEDVDRLPWWPVAGCPGVWQKQLWRFDGYVQALIRHEPGSSTPGEPHLAAHHHVWVISGSARMAGRRLTAGSYVHVPPGVAHGIDDVGPEGFLVLQMHRPHAPQEAAGLE